MRKALKQHVPIILAFSLPLIFILGFALTTYVPAFFVKTNYNFVYATCTDDYNYNYDCNSYLKERFLITNNRLVISEVTDMVYEHYYENEHYVQNNHEFRIFLHDTQTNESREMTPDEATGLRYSSLLTSPDGITISNDYRYNGGDFLIFGGGSSSYGHYLTKGNRRSKINTINNSDRYQNNFEFIGWIVP